MAQHPEAVREAEIVFEKAARATWSNIPNAAMENFFGIMKTEMFYGYEFEFKSLESLKKAMEEYIDYYNNRRIKSKLKGMSPVEFREHSCQN